MSEHDLPKRRFGRWGALAYHRVAFGWNKSRLGRLQKQLDPDEPHFERSELRTVYMGAGAALVVAGVAVIANWVSIVQAANKPNALRVAGPMFYFGLVVVVLGIYCFVASMSGSRWLPLPGKSSMLRATESRRLRDEMHRIALDTLGFARLAGLVLRETQPLDPDEVHQWYLHVIGVGMDVWGASGLHLMNIINVDEMLQWDRQKLRAEVVNPTLLHIEATILRVSSSTVQPDKAKLERLHASSDFFSALVDRVLKPGTQSR